MRRHLLFAVAFLLLLSPAVLLAQSAPPAFSRDAVGVKSFPAAPRLAERAAIAPAALLGPADASQIEEIHAYNETGGNPARNGFLRRFAERIQVRLNGAVASKGVATTTHAGGVVAASERGLVWSGSFKIEGAHRVRLRLENVKLPAGAVLWVYGDGDTPIAFDRDLIDSTGSLWTPSVRGGNIRLEVEIAAPKSDTDAVSFDVNEVMQLIAPRVVTKPDDDPVCLVDITCVNDSIIGNASRAVAQLEFVNGNGSFVCSGGLINDLDTAGFIPYLLTANHCFSTQTAATSLEAFWDWRFANCESATIPDPAGFPRSNGSALLATGMASDFTFIRLSSVPANRLFLGWNASPVAVGSGETLHRISHPAPEQTGVLPQTYSNTRIDVGFSPCLGLTPRLRPQYIYSTGGVGGVYGGSSGAPAFTASGQVVGQLLGSCGPAPSSGCDSRNATVDGAFATTFPSVRQFLEGTATQPCVPGPTNICLNNDRFSVTVTWRTRDNQSGQGQGVEYTAESGLFWFFNESNIEMLVKVLNGCPLNGRYWVFFAATTDVEYTVTVTDTKTGVLKTYFHPLGTPAPAVTDTGAFATCP